MVQYHAVLVDMPNLRSQRAGQAHTDCFTPQATLHCKATPVVVRACAAGAAAACMSAD